MAGSVTVAALRYRPRQALLVIALAAVVTAAAALGPLYARAVEQSVLRNVIAEAPVAQATVVVTDAGTQPAPPPELRRAIRTELPRQLSTPIGGAEAPVALLTGADAPSRARLTSRDAVCDHVTLVAGRCFDGPDELLVSARAAELAEVAPGDRVVLSDGDPANGGVRRPATVVGLYGGVDLSAPYWAGRGGSSTSARPTADERAVRSIDDVFTSWDTLAGAPWPDLRTHLDARLLASRTTLEDVPRLSTLTKDVDAQARTLGASATSGLGELLTETQDQRRQARTVIPLLAVQLAVLGVVVLGFVCAAATEQRRPEIALARLRGHGTGGAAAMLLRELGALVVAGAVVGAALAWVAAEGVSRWWLEPGVRPEMRAPVWLAVAASVVAGLLAVVVAGTPTLRQPLTSLLRRIPPRATTLQAGLVEGAVAAAAVAGLVTLFSGAGGAVALLAPGLLAIAGGLLLAQLMIPTAGPLSRFALRRGRLPSALAGLQIARRPALRRLIAIITVACALLVFAVDAWTVAGRNRSTRAEVEAGAPVVLTVDADSSLALRRAVLGIDPEGRFATPVVTVSSATETGPKTTAVEPAAFTRVARWGGDSRQPTQAQLAALSPTRPAPVHLTGDRLAVRATVRVTGVPRAQGDPEPELGGPVSLALGLADQDGVLHLVDLGPMTEGTRTYRSDIDCAQGCDLEQVSVLRTFGDFVDADIDLSLTDLRAGSGRDLLPVDLDTATTGAWQAVPLGAVPWAVGGVDVAVSGGQALHLFGTSFGTPLVAQRGTHPVTPVALVAGDVPAVPSSPSRPGRFVTAQALSTGDTAYAVAGRLPQVPRAGPRGVLVDLAALVTGPAVAPAQTSYAVWLAHDDPARERRLTQQLADRGIDVVARDTVAAHVAALGREGPSLALRLALLAGLVAVVLAAAVLVVGVATSGASRARDLAGLRIVGVPAAVVRRASVAEHVVVAVLGVLAGAALGLVAAQAALPEIPLFATRVRTLPLVLDPAWRPVLVTTLGCLVLLCAVSVVVGRTLARSAVPARLREGAR